MNCDGIQNSFLKIRMDLCINMDLVTVEYIAFSQMLHLIMWFFPFITGISCR